MCIFVAVWINVHEHTYVHKCGCVCIYRMDACLCLHWGILMHPFLPVQPQASFWNVHLPSLSSDDPDLQALTEKQSSHMSG